MSDCAIVLAAGNSGRMGREKARLPWLEGKPLLRWTLDALTAAGWRPFVVLGPAHFETWHAELPAGCTVLNPAPARGKATSLAAGLRAVPAGARRILIAAVDQPRPPALYERLRLEPGDGKILVPDHAGRRGHPVAVDSVFRRELLALEEASLGLRGWLDGHRAETQRLTEGDSRWPEWNLNTPAAYAEALDFFRGAGLGTQPPSRDGGNLRPPRSDERGS